VLLTGGSVFIMMWIFFTKGSEIIKGKAISLKKDIELYPSPVSKIDQWQKETQFNIELPIYLLEIQTQNGNIFTFKLTREDYEQLKYENMEGEKITILFNRDKKNLYVDNWYKV